MNNTTYFLEDITKYGREFDTQILSENQDLTVYDINSFQPRFNSGLFQSVMRVLEIDANYKIEKGSYVTGKLGIKFDRDEYEYLTYENYYISDEPEYDEDTKAYVFTAYDKMIEAMIDFDMVVTYPITVREFIIAICERLGWDTSGIAETFINSETELIEDVYTGVGYTYRDILDEIAKITCTFPGFYDGVFQLKYIADTGQTITNDYLSEDNLTFEKEFYINSVVFSRAEESDNYYKQDADSIAENGLHEYMLSDLQILSTDNRSVFMEEMYEYLITLRFWIFNVKTTGIFVFEPADMFTIQTDTNSYSVVCLNSEGVIEQGLTETIYMEDPDETGIEYSASTSDEKADRATKILVDKVNQKITATIESVEEQSTKISEITQTVDEIVSQIENELIMTTEKTQSSNLHITDTVAGEGYLIQMRITGNMPFLYPEEDLYPSDDLLPLGGSFTLIIDKQDLSSQSDEAIEIEIKLDEPLRYYTEDIYDEILYEDGVFYLIRRVGVDEDGNMYMLDNAEQTVLYEQYIYTFDEDTYIYIKEYNDLTFYAYYIHANDYSEYYATKVELNSAITQTTESIMSTVTKTLESYSTTTEMYSAISQTAEEINLTVSKKIGEDEVISSINQSAEAIELTAGRLIITAGNFQLDESGNITAVSGTIGGFTIGSSYLANGTTKLAGASNSVYLGTDGISCGNVFKVTKEGIVTIYGGSSTEAHLSIVSASDSSTETYITPDFLQIDATEPGITLSVNDSTNYIGIYANATDQSIWLGPYVALYSKTSGTSFIRCYGSMIAQEYTYTSLEELKKNIEACETTALDIVENSQIYTYHYKNEEDTAKKHLGFVIGENYNTPCEVIAQSGEGIDSYSMSSILWKSVQELIENIQNLEERIKTLEGEE